MIKIEKIYEARQRIKNIIKKTPCSLAPYLSEISNTKVYLKKENLQITGAYKLRGAYNKISLLKERKNLKGVIAASAGNHAQGIAYASKIFNIKSIIVMPIDTPLTKVNGVSSLGGEIILKGNNYDEAYMEALKIAKENQFEFIHPFEDEDVIAGQGTIALEILEDIKDLDAILVPIGGGGLISGIASVIKTIKPDIKVIGVNAKGANSILKSFYSKKAINLDSVRTIADGIAVKNTSNITLKHILSCVDEIIDVSDEEIASAILLLLEKQKLVVEGAGSVGVAAILHKKLNNKKAMKKIATILTGGNIDITMLNVIIEKGLLKTARKLKLIVYLIDKPGSLMSISKILNEIDANIVHIEYDRTSTNIDYGDATVSLSLETKGEKHKQLILKSLEDNMYKFKELR